MPSMITRPMVARSIRRGTLLVAIAAAPQSSGAQERAPTASFPPDSTILAIIRQRVEERRSVGIVVGLLEADGTRRVIAHGDPGPGKLPLDGSSVFEIGSITKVFTGILLAQMVLAGEVGLEDPVRKFMPPGVTVPQRNGIEITLGHLAQHKSGLPRMPTNFRPADPDNPYADYTPELLYEFLSGHTLTRDPGAQQEYSNVGLGLLGHALARAAGKSYEELQRERIWEPLGLGQTSITLTEWGREHLALGHSPSGRVVPNWDDLEAFAGAGAIRSTANDLLHFLFANVHPDRGPLGPAVAFAQAKHPVPGSATKGYLTWWLAPAPGDTILWHNGGSAGYRTFIGMSLPRKVGVVVLTNSGGEGADDIALHLLDPRSPLAPKPWAWMRVWGIGLTAFGLGLALVMIGMIRRRRRRAPAPPKFTSP